MTQIWLLWWPKNPTTTKIHGSDVHQQQQQQQQHGNTTTTIGASSASASSSSSSHCSCVSKLVRKLKRNFRMLGSGLSTRTSPQHAGGSKYLQCRYKYDPLSYSLNFDSSGSGNLDEDYYHFYAFSSRFVANPSSCPTLPTATTAH